MKRTILGAVAGLAAAGSALGAVQHTINFDTDANGLAIADKTPLTSQFAPWGVSFADHYFTPGATSGSGSSGNRWDTSSDLTMTSTDIGGGVPSNAGNVLRSFNGWLNEDGDPNILITFSTPLTSIQMDLVGLGTSMGWSGFLAFSGSVQVGDVRTTLSGGLSQTLSLSGVGPITSVVVLPGTFDDWVGIDNIQITQAPAPAGAAVLAAGVLGASRRRRRD